MPFLFPFNQKFADFTKLTKKDRKYGVQFNRWVLLQLVFVNAFIFYLIYKFEPFYATCNSKYFKRYFEQHLQEEQCKINIAQMAWFLFWCILIINFIYLFMRGYYGGTIFVVHSLDDIPYEAKGLDRIERGIPMLLPKERFYEETAIDLNLLDEQNQNEP